MTRAKTMRWCTLALSAGAKTSARQRSPWPTLALTHVRTFGISSDTMFALTVTPSSTRGRGVPPTADRARNRPTVRPEMVRRGGLVVLVLFTLALLAWLGGPGSEPPMTVGILVLLLAAGVTAYLLLSSPPSARRAGRLGLTRATVLVDGQATVDTVPHPCCQRSPSAR